MTRLDKSNWITSHAPPELTGFWRDLIDTGNAVDPRQWDVLLQSWGSRDVLSVGPFDDWDAAQEWAAYRVEALGATCLGIAQHRRPKGTDLVDVRLRKVPAAKTRGA